MKPFPPIPDLQGAFAPWPNEGEINDLSVTGSIPEDLRGTYYRNGPNPQYVTDERYHLFDGDGMIHAFAFGNRGVSYRNRWVRTEKFGLERAAGRSLFGGMRNRWKDPSVADRSPNAANTHVVRHGGRLLALWEAGFPTEVDPATLETRGRWDFHGRLDRAMTAHPKIDPASGDLLFYSYVFGASRELVFFRADKAGAIVESRKIPVPFHSMMHDFAVTENFIVFPLFPLTLKPERIALGQNPIAWEPGLGTRFALVPRSGDGEIRWFRTAACFAFHFMNAFEDMTAFKDTNASEEKGAVILDAIVGDRIPDDAQPFQGGKDEFPTRLIRWTLDLGTGGVGKEILDETPCEMPRIDDRFCGRKYRQGYYIAQLQAEKPAGRWDALVRFDFPSRTRQVLPLGEGDVVNEAVFVSRSGGGEGEGYLLALVYREKTGTSDLLILDAARIDAGPIAVVHVPHRVPFGFHGSWVGEEDAGPE